MADAETPNVVSFAAHAARKQATADQAASEQTQVEVDMNGERAVVCFSPGGGDAQVWTDEKLRRYFHPSVNALPFIVIGKEGRPEKWWNVDAEAANAKGAYGTAHGWGAAMADAMSSDVCGGIPLSHVLEAIVDDTVRRRLKGGNGSRRTSSAVNGFLSGLCLRIAEIIDAQYAFDADLLWSCAQATKLWNKYREAARAADGKGQRAQAPVNKARKQFELEHERAMATPATTIRGLQAKTRLLEMSGDAAYLIADILAMKGGTGALAIRAGV